MHFESYNSWEEMADAMATAEAVANSRVTPQQRRIGPGDSWMTPVEPGLFVFGRVQRPWELVRAELLGITRYGSNEEQLKRGKAQAKSVIAAMGDRHWFSDLVESELTDVKAMTHRFGVAVRTVIPPLEGFDDAEGGEALAARLEEFGSTLETTRLSWRRGYRYGTAYSTVMPSGEFGSTHISEMIPLRLAEFASAKAAGWDFHLLCHPASQLSTPWARDMVLSGQSIGSLHRREVRQ